MRNIGDEMDRYPVVGHAKGIYHMLSGETQRGWRAFKAATIGVGGMLGQAVGGPVGAAAGKDVTKLLLTELEAADQQIRRPIKRHQ